MSLPESVNYELITDPIVRIQTLATLWTRVGAGMELFEAVPSDIGMKSRSGPWNEANKHLIRLAGQDYKNGLRLAKVLIELPQTGDSQQGVINQWMATSGLMLLGLDGVKEEFANNLSNTTSALANRLRQLMSVDLSDFTVPNNFNGDPTGYSTIQSVYVCLGLKDRSDKLSKSLYTAAKIRSTDPDFKVAYGVVSSFSDCAYLKSRFKNK